MSNPVDVWLRGPVEGIDPQLQPVAHTLMQVLEDMEELLAGMDSALLWKAPETAASIGFHLRHLTGATERLFTYARGEQLSRTQIDTMKSESHTTEALPSGAQLTAILRNVVDAAVAQLRKTPASMLGDRREVGRAKLPSTVLGLLFHAAEHAQRHAGQITTTAMILKNM